MTKRAMITTNMDKRRR